MRRANRHLVLVTLLSGCARAPIGPSTVPVTEGPSTVEPTRATRPASSTFPAPRAQIVAQTVESEEPVPMRVLADGSVVLVDVRGVHLVTPGVGIVRRIELPYDRGRRLRGADPAGRWVATQREFVSLSSGTVRTLDDQSTVAGCSVDGSRCVVVAIATADAFAVRIEAPDSEEPLDRFELPLPFGGARANEIDVAHVAAAIDGDRLALLLPMFGVVTPAVYAIGTRTLVGTRPPSPPTEETIEFVDDRLLFTSQQGFSLVDPSDHALATVATLRTQRVMDSVGADFATALLEGGWATVNRRTLEHSQPGVREGAAPIVGAGHTAFVSETDVTWIDGDTSQSVALDPASVPYEATMTERGLYVLHDGHGLSVFDPDGTEPSFVPIERLAMDYERLRVSIGERGLSIGLGEHSIAIGDAGSSATPAAELADYESLRVAREALMSRLAPTHHPDQPALVAAPLPGSPLGVAFVEAGSLHVLDAEGAAVGRPIPLPANVRRSGCYALDFLSDVDVGLHGRRPCIPTRIHFRDRATFDPLGRAFVAVSSTPDGSRVAVMANRRVLVLDGRTGATIAEVDPHVISPRNIRIADDGSEVVLFGADVAVVDLGALPSPDAIRRVVQLPNTGWAYSSELARLVGCAEGVLTIAAPLAPESTKRWPAAACRDGSAYGSIGIGYERAGEGDPRVVALSARFVALSSTSSLLSVVRLRDGVELRVGLLVSRTMAEAIVTLGDVALGVYPPEATHVLSIGPDGRRSPMPTPTADSEAAIAAFFGD